MAYSINVQPYNDPNIYIHIGSSTTTSGERCHHHTDATSRQSSGPKRFDISFRPRELLFFFILFTTLYRFMYQRKRQMSPPPVVVSTTVAIGTKMTRDDGRMRGERPRAKRRRIGMFFSFLSHFIFILLTFFWIQCTYFPTTTTTKQ